MATKHKASPAQLAARKRFAEAARNGTLQKGARLKNPRAKENMEGTRVKNPLKTTEGMRRKNPDVNTAEDLRAENPKRRSVKSEIASRKAQARSIGASTHIYIVESSKNGKAWQFEECYLGPSAAKTRAETIAENYPHLYVRIRKETTAD